MINDKSIIERSFSIPMLKLLLFNALRTDINDINLKAKIISHLLTKDGFIEIGTGTNRIVFSKDGLIFKIAIDRRGLIDNITEFKRAEELQEVVAMTYESNVVINVCEYVTVMSHEMFTTNNETIREVLSDLSESYLFDDIGYTIKNSYNWGYRTSSTGEETVVILDYGYMYPLVGQDMDQLFKCRSCGGKLTSNGNYTLFRCTNMQCSTTRTPSQLEDLMDKTISNEENKLIAEIPHGAQLSKMVKDVMSLANNIK